MLYWIQRYVYRRFYERCNGYLGYRSRCGRSRCCVKDQSAITFHVKTCDSFDTGDPNLIKFTAPSHGYYMVSEQITYCIPTGRTETVKNESRKYFQFWKPKMITREIFIIEKKHDGQRMVYLEKGQTVETKMAYRL